PVRGGVARCKRNRLHGDLAHRLAACGVHPAVVHDRPGRTHVPGICADARYRGGGLCRGLADVDADDVQSPAAASIIGGDRGRHHAQVPRPGRLVGGALPAQPRMGAAPRNTDARRHRRNPGGDRVALHHHSQGLSAAAGHRPDLRGHGRRAGSLVHRDETAAGGSGGRNPQGSRCDRRGLGDRREPDQRPALPRPRGDDANAAVTAGIHRLPQAAAGVPGIVIFFRPVQDIQISTRLSRAQYQYTLTGTEAKEVGEWAARLADRLRSSTVLQDVASEAQDNGFRMNVDIDRETASRLGISMQTVIDTLSDAFGQRQISTIYGQSNQYRVILEAKPEYQNDPNSLAKIYVPASGIQAVAQSTSLTSTSPTVIPTVTGSSMVPPNPIPSFHYRLPPPLILPHQAQSPAATISLNLAPDAALSDAVRVISEAEPDIGMPSSVIGSYSGDAAEFAKSLAGEPWLILAAAVAIYIVLGVLYESFI